ncbi:MAG TPA: tetratricopeptide repeat protein, partial [Thermodesulfobium narugense]|nr:tetratricopeptide repeat protein [Thermodesulfobium narugense]
MEFNLEDSFKEISKDIESSKFQEALDKINYIFNLIDANQIEVTSNFLIDLLDTKSFILTVMGRNAEALENINRAIEEKNSTSTNNDDQMAKLLIHRGLNYFYLENFDSSLKDFNSAIEILQNLQSDDKSIKLSQTFLNRSVLFKKQGLKNKSLEDINSAISQLNKENSPKHAFALINALIEKGLLLMEEEKFFESAYNFNVALSKSRELLNSDNSKILGT